MTWCYNRRVGKVLEHPADSHQAPTVRGGQVMANQYSTCPSNPRKVVALEDRFWAKVRKSEGCWTWTGNVNPKHGYGEIQHGPRGAVVRYRAHRLAWILTHGHIPNGLVVMHVCDNRTCVNPDHLALGTVAANNLDMLRKGRQVAWNKAKTHCINGHPFDAKNTRYKSDGFRACRSCEAARRAARKVSLAEGGCDGRLL